MFVTKFDFSAPQLLHRIVSKPHQETRNRSFGTAFATDAPGLRFNLGPFLAFVLRAYLFQYFFTMHLYFCFSERCDESTGAIATFFLECFQAVNPPGIVLRLHRVSPPGSFGAALILILLATKSALFL
jgi:hypothetical protein